MNDCVTGGEAARNNMAFMVRSQNDVYMVINNNGAEINSNHDDLEEAIATGRLTIGEMQRCAMNILKLILNSPVMERPLKPLNPLITLAGASTADAEVKTYHICENPEVLIGSDKKVVVHVEKTGTFNVVIKMMSPLTNLSQSSTNVIVNGMRFTTIQTCGTDGRWITEKMLRIILEKGYYMLEFEVMKPGIEIEYLAFEQV